MASSDSVLKKNVIHSGTSEPLVKIVWQTIMGLFNSRQWRGLDCTVYTQSGLYCKGLSNVIDSFGVCCIILNFKLFYNFTM